MSITPTKWNPTDKGANISLSNGDLTATATADYGAVRSVFSASTGKWYWEIKVEGTQYLAPGIATSAAPVTYQFGNDAYSWVRLGNGWRMNNTVHSTYGDEVSVADYYGFALDMDNGKIWVSRNGVWPDSGDPSTGANPMYSGLSGIFYAGFSGGIGGTPAKGTANFGASSFSYTVPSGYTSGFGELPVAEHINIFSSRKLNIFNPFPILGGV